MFLADDYRRNGLIYCSNMIEHYKNVNFIKFHHLQYDDHHTCITGLVLDYPIENSIALIIRDDNNGEYFDFEEYNKNAIEEDHMNDEDCDCNECDDRRYKIHNKEQECKCNLYRYDDDGEHVDCDICNY